MWIKVPKKIIDIEGTRLQIAIIVEEGNAQNCCLITKFKTWTWNAVKRFSKGAHYYTVKSAYISPEINLVLFLCISYLAERVCSCAPLGIEESIGGNVGGSRLVIQSHVGNLAISRVTRAATALQIQNCPCKQPTISRRFRRDFSRAILSKFDHDWNLKQLCGYLRTKTPYQLRSGENCYALCRHATSQLLMNQKKIVSSVRRIDPGQSKNV